jgi:hypothetical protein
MLAMLIVLARKAHGIQSTSAAPRMTLAFPRRLSRRACIYIFTSDFTPVWNIAVFFNTATNSQRYQKA